MVNNAFFSTGCFDVVPIFVSTHTHIAVGVVLFHMIHFNEDNFNKFSRNFSLCLGIMVLIFVICIV